MATAQEPPGSLQIETDDRHLWLTTSHAREQHWVPFVGGALALGAFQFGRQLLGLAPSPPGVSQTFVKVGAAPEALGGVLYCPASFFALRFSASYTYMFVAKTSAHALTETVDIRFMF